MPVDPPPAFAAIRITATSTATPRAIPSHAFQVQPPRRFIPLELFISNLLRSRTPLIPTFAIRAQAAHGSSTEGEEASPILREPWGWSGDGPNAGLGLPLAASTVKPSTFANRLADTDLVEVTEEVGRIVVDAVRAGALELLEAVAAGQQADPEGPRSPGGEQVPNA